MPFPRRSGIGTPEPADDLDGAALVTVVARRLRGMAAVLLARADAVGHEPDPRRLLSLAELHQAIDRLDRYCDSLLALAGVPFGRPEAVPVDLLDLLAAAASTVERHTQVELGVVDSDVTVSGWVAGHVQHAVTELLDNATFFSPPDSPVTLDAWLVDTGLLVRVVDRGVGIGPVRLAELNRLLGTPSALGPGVLRESGLPVVAVLATWHNWTVRLDSRPRAGTVAELLLPPAALATVPGDDGRPGQPGGGMRGVGKGDVDPRTGHRATGFRPAGPPTGHPAAGFRPAGPPTGGDPAGGGRQPSPTRRPLPRVGASLPSQRGIRTGGDPGTGQRAVPGNGGPGLPRREPAVIGAAAPTGGVSRAVPPMGDPATVAAALAAYQRGRLSSAAGGPADDPTAYPPDQPAGLADPAPGAVDGGAAPAAPARDRPEPTTHH